MSGAKRAVVLAAATFTLGMAACTSDETPTSPSADPGPAFAISDGAHGGNPHFYFLPPLVAAPHPTGAFDPTLNPTVRVCPLPACATDLVTFTTGSGPGQVTIDVGEEAYRVNWHTRNAGLSVGGQYRVRVFVGTQLLGFLDLQVVPKGGPPAAVPAGFVRLREGHPLLIKFRIEEGALAPAPENRIAFLRTNNLGGIFTRFDIFVVNADGTGEVQLTDAPGNDHQLDWSPDGSKIVFVSERGDFGEQTNNEIFVMNADGSGQTQLTDTPGTHEQDPTWSPDGGQIAFARGGLSGNAIVVMDGDGSNQTPLTAAFGRAPRWSPDGSRIVFVRRIPNTESGRDEIFVMNADGSNQTRLTDNSSEDNDPAWFPDGSRIVFRSLRDGNSEIYVMNADGSGQTNLTTDPGFDGDFELSPDGARIVFVSGDPGGIFLMDSDGSDKTNLAPFGFGLQPSWSPDGHRIAFVRLNRDETLFDIWAMNADGSGAVQLTNQIDDDIEPDWSP
jgi:Tol biopolymer transport system component